MRLWVRMGHDNSRKRQELALYGSVHITRRYCEHCETWAFVIRGKFACCDRRPPDPEGRTKLRRVSPTTHRDFRSIAVMKRCLLEQNYECIYCGASLSLQTAEYEHFIPWSFIDSTGLSVAKEENIVASCHACNAAKRMMVFNSLEEARVYIFVKRALGKNPVRKAG